MLHLQFLKVDLFTYRCLLDGDLIGTVFYSPTAFYSWIFQNPRKDIWTFGTTKYQATKLYLQWSKGMISHEK